MKLSVLCLLLSVFIPAWLRAQATPTVMPSPTAFATATPTLVVDEKTPLGHEASQLYNELNLGSSGLAYEAFKEAVVGYYNIKASFDIQKPVLSIVDFDLPSTAHRLWIIDLEKKSLLQNCLVAHGKQTGANTAVKFSNDLRSAASSLGFYVTKGTYQGKNGLSLQLDGIDQGYNNNAMKRAVVVHGAAYVSEKFVQTYGRLGRSWGCPAVPVELLKDIVGEIARGSVLFIHKSDAGYQSKYLDEDSASALFLKGDAPQTH